MTEAEHRPAEPSITSSSGWWLGATVVAALLLLVFIAQAVLHGFPHSADEYAYQYQARTFAAGRLQNPAAPDPDLFAVMHVISTADAMYSKYPPGWPAVLAPGVSAGMGFLVNPLIAALTLLLFGAIARAVSGALVAMVAVVLLATNPYFLFNGASWYAHPLVALAALGCAVCVWRYDETPRTRFALLAGLALSFVVLARPQDAVLLSIGLLPGAIFVLRRAEGPRLARDAAAGAAVVIGALLLYAAYNAATNGHPLVFGHTVYAGEDLPGLDPLGMVVTFANRGVEYLTWSPVVLLAFALLGTWLARRGDARPLQRPQRLGWLLLAGIALAFWLGYASYGALDYPPRYGPRYLLPSHAPLVLLAAVALARLVPARAVRLAAIGIAAAQLTHVALIARSLETTVEAAGGLQRAADALEREIHPRLAYVVVAGPSGSVPSFDLIRNDLEYAAPVLFVRGPLPGRALYYWDGLGGVPTLWTPDRREPVRAVFAGDELDRVAASPTQRGWIRTSGSNTCRHRLMALPGQRSPSWARFGPCPSSIEASVIGATGAARAETVERVGWPGVDGRVPADSYVHYRAHVKAKPGGYDVRVASPAECVLRHNGDVVLENTGQQPASATLHFSAGAEVLALSCASGHESATLDFSILGPAGRPLPRHRFFTHGTLVAAGHQP